jgi:hypothetical protein
LLTRRTKKEREGKERRNKTNGGRLERLRRPRSRYCPGSLPRVYKALVSATERLDLRTISKEGRGVEDRLQEQGEVAVEAAECCKGSLALCCVEVVFAVGVEVVCDVTRVSSGGGGGTRGRGWAHFQSAL